MKWLWVSENVQISPRAPWGLALGACGSAGRRAQPCSMVMFEGAHGPQGCAAALAAGKAATHCKKALTTQRTCASAHAPSSLILL